MKEFEEIAVKNEKKKTNYAEFFNYEFRNDGKVGVCLLCKKEDLVEIPMVQSNTSGLKKHLLRHHSTAYESLFGPLISNLVQKLDKFVTVSQNYVTLYTQECGLIIIVLNDIHN